MRGRVRVRARVRVRVRVRVGVCVCVCVCVSPSLSLSLSLSLSFSLPLGPFLARSAFSSLSIFGFVPYLAPILSYLRMQAVSFSIPWVAIPLVRDVLPSEVGHRLTRVNVESTSQGIAIMTPITT